MIMPNQVKNKTTNGWQETTLGERVKVGRGSSPRPIHDFISDHGVPWVKIADASASETRYILKTKEFIKEEGRSTSVNVGDLIVSNSATPGIPKFMGIDACVHDGWLVFSDYKELDKLYLYYFFLDYRRTLEHSASGTVFVNLQTEIVKNIEINLPPLTEQRSIAAVLSSLDDKIEFLRIRSRTLENIAHTLFKRWFIDFDFPNKEGKPYISSGGEMIDSGLGEIPKRWRKGTLGDIIAFQYGKAMKEENRSGKGYPVFGSNGIVGYHDEFLVKGGGIVIGRKGTMGSVTWAEESFYPIDTTFYVEDNLGVDLLYFHYLLLLKQNFGKIGSDSAVPGLNRNSAYAIDTIIPQKEIVNKFNLAVNPIFLKLKLNNLQIKNLSKTRDTVLPKLMKGEVRVKQFKG
jgi:type I restriction enzyme S subunit